MRSLQIDWALKYGIPQNNQLIFEYELPMKTANSLLNFNDAIGNKTHVNMVNFVIINI